MTSILLHYSSRIAIDNINKKQQHVNDYSSILWLPNCPRGGATTFSHHLLRFLLLDENGKFSKRYVGNIIIWVKIEDLNPIYVSKP